MKCSILGAVFVLLVLIEHSQGVAFPPATKTKYETYLKEFDNVRGHITFAPQLDANRQKVISFMKSKFVAAAGLQVHLQNFTSTDTNTGKAVNGTNLIAVLPGYLYKQSQDEVIILAAHIDTFGRAAGGVNNDGSGLVGLLAVAEALTGDEKCERNKTIIFAAFDRSETENLGPGITHCNKSCGSLEFIKDMKTFIGDAKVKLVMVLDCLANFATTVNSQKWSSGLNTYFHNTVLQEALTDSPGDFLAVSGRTNEKTYIQDYNKIFDAAKVEGEFRVVQFKWDIQGTPTAENRTNLISAFKDGDQISFWDNNLNAILLTDTCYDRDYMAGSCKTTTSCDTFNKITAKDLSFMYTTLYSASKLINKYTCLGACQQCDVSADCTNNVCVCKSGFTGNGITCTDIDECKTNPCSKYGTCSDTRGSYKCLCKDGYTGNGLICKVKTGDASVVQAGSHVFLFSLVTLLSYYIFM